MNCRFRFPIDSPLLRFARRASFAVCFDILSPQFDSRLQS